MKTIEVLKQIQADSIVFFMKTHNYHWNVKGANFPQIHAATQEIYENFADIFDDVAERIIQLGGIPYVTLADTLKASKIVEESKQNFSANEVLDGVLKDYKYFEGIFKELSKIADENGDKVTAGFADEKVGQLQKALWMLNAQKA
ncbi:DNA starvation/stationary phase protection protein [Helicobacter cholecystus]|uniref:DNA starvation/stationary phase protection protein n=1 Tax=Helicobacter cholecystus TaxID=45498 RepID=A0A3D8ISD8_9HELI|nr:DNA starvation/stationary phase protection protein [Helicobacter cholecystus]RDU68189.1 DNA starvation/stationary phase protection protein [Helicobacter cholecystus]VEJ26067.1 neutrophil-activating protein [Helicobacter cholecystus]